MLHIYAQNFWHDEAYIVGTQESLRLLRNAIDTALKTGRGKAECFVCDGEGYTIEVVVIDGDSITKMVLPYTDQIAKDLDEDKVKPWSLV